MDNSWNLHSSKICILALLSLLSAHPCCPGYAFPKRNVKDYTVYCNWTKIQGSFKFCCTCLALYLRIFSTTHTSVPVGLDGSRRVFWGQHFQNQYLVSRSLWECCPSETDVVKNWGDSVKCPNQFFLFLRICWDKHSNKKNLSTSSHSSTNIPQKQSQYWWITHIRA